MAGPDTGSTGDQDHLAPVARRDGAGLPVSRPTPAPDPAAPGPMAGLRVVELAHPFGAFAGKLLADAGADVIVVEPSTGAEQRSHAPFAEGRAGPETSLAWWAENTSKRSAICDWATSADERRRLRALLDRADVLIECA
ncbi:MAG: CoA transferase, partial [Actinomycetota bacterium]